MKPQYQKRSLPWNIQDASLEMDIDAAERAQWTAIYRSVGKD